MLLRQHTPDRRPAPEWPQSVDVRFGLLMTLVAVVAGAGWVAATPELPGRAAIAATLALTALVDLGAAVVALGRTRASARLAAVLLPLWSASALSSVLVVLAAVGDATHVAMLFVCAPIAFTALAYPYRLALGMSVLACTSWTAVAVALGTPGGEVVLGAAALASIAGFCLRQAATQRRRADELRAVALRERALAELRADGQEARTDDELLEVTARALRRGAPGLACTVVQQLGPDHHVARAGACPGPVPLRDWLEDPASEVVPVAGGSFDGCVVARAAGRAPTEADARFVTGVAGVFAALAQRRHADERLRLQALQDPLTKLPNRRLIEERIASAIAGASPAAVLLLDLDGFKEVNDVFGHRTGDAVLRAVAERLAATLRPQDALARFGGDEFVVLCEGLPDPEAALAVAARLLRAFEHPVVVGGEGRRATAHVVRASVGVAWVPPRDAAAAEDVLRDADLAMYEAKRADLRLNVNVSAEQLDGLADVVAGALQDAGADPERLVVEITETSLLEDAAGAERELRALRDLGVGVALDDFGTGFSSLAHVARFPLTEIKLDRAFVGGLADRPQDAAVAEAVCVLADRLGADVVAEGVELAAQADVLRRLGAGLAQGYHFARPTEIGDFLRLARAPRVAA